MSLVRIASQAPGVLQDPLGNSQAGRAVNVFLRGGSVPVSVYSDATGATPLPQPLTTDISGEVPGYVASGVSVDLYDTITGNRIEMEPLRADDVGSTSLAGYALLASPTFTGTPRATTAPIGTNSTQLATTAFVIGQQTEVPLDNYITGAPDLATALQNAITAAQGTSSGGRVKFGTGKVYTHTTGTVPKFAKNVPCEVDMAGATIQMSSTVKVPWTLVTPTPGDTYTGLFIHDGIFDHQNQSTNSACMFGTVGLNDFNITGFKFHRLKSINVHQTAGNIMLIVSSPTAARSITDVDIRDITMGTIGAGGGGNVGISVIGSGGATGTGSNVFIDVITVDGFKHSVASTAPAAFATGLHVQIGSTGYCGTKITVRNGYGENSPDVGVELDAPTRALCQDVTVKDNYNQALFYTKFRDVVSPGQQRITFRDCHSIVTSSTLSGAAKFCALQQSAGQALGTNVWENCTYERSATGGVQNLAAGEVFALGGVGAAASTVNGEVIIRSFSSTVENFTGDNVASATWVMAGFFFATAPTVVPRLTIDGWTSSVTGTQGAQVLNMRHVQIEGATQLDLRAFTFSHNVASMTGNVALLTLGVVGATINGTIDGLYIKSYTATTGLNMGLQVNGTGTLSIPSELVLQNAWFGNFTGGGGTEARFNGAQNRNKVRLRNIHYLPSVAGNSNALGARLPAAMSTSNFTTAAFATTVWNQYLGGHDADIVLTAAGTAGITAIDISPDNGTTITTLFTQASAALAQNFTIPSLPNGWYVRITGTTPPAGTVVFKP